MKKEEFYEKRGLDRIINLSDAVFAFSLTLLTVDLVVPELQGASGSLLIHGLTGEYNKFLYFILTFFITASYWTSHHRIYRFIERYDAVLIRINLYFLFFITLMPFITKMISEYGHLQVAVVICALGYAIPGFLLSVMWHYASRDHLLLKNGIPVDFSRRTRIKNYIRPMIFIFSIPFSFINPSYTLYFWILLLPASIILNYVFPDIADED